MPNKQEKSSGSDLGVDPPSDKDGDDAEFVEVDPTGRYGRVGSLQFLSKKPTTMSQSYGFL
jgi:hypothetical protein